MSKHMLDCLLSAALMAFIGCEPVRKETPYGKGMTEANKERLVLDDMEDVSDWYNGSPEETTISASDRHVKQGKFSLLFANVVDHTKGETNYPIGWPRTGKDMSSINMTDWSGCNFFECWIYAETSRESLPGTPLSVGFYHTGHKRSSSFTLKEVKKDEWVKIVIPISALADATDVQRVQFNIAESNYKHGDKVDFYIDDMVLTRFLEPAIAELSIDKKLLYSNDSQITAFYKLAGRKGIGQATAEFEIGRGIGARVSGASAIAARSGELSVAPPRERMIPGTYWARLSLRDAEGKLIDRKQVEFRVLSGPF